MEENIDFSKILYQYAMCLNRHLIQGSHILKIDSFLHGI